MKKQDWEEPCGLDYYEGKYCSDCCHFIGMFDDMLRNQGYGFCKFQQSEEAGHRDDECYYPDKYERCFW